jgi:cytochrome c biogenesis protein CcdA
VIALLGALVAGALTTLAPCVLPVLPVVLGGSALHRRAAVIIASLGASIFLFTMILKATTALIGVPRTVWQVVSGGLLIGLGLAVLLPRAWERLGGAWQVRSATGLASAHRRSGLTGQILTGIALGPVFSSCSPLYAYVVVTAFPASPGYALALLTTYVIGLCGTLAVIAALGRRAITRLGWAADPSGWFRRGLGVVFVSVGVLVLFGLDRDLQAWVIENSPVAPWNLDRGFIPDS